MRRSSLCLFLAVALGLISCHSSPASRESGSSSTSGMSLEQMKAGYQKLHEQYVADCIDGDPQHIQDDLALCAEERKEMTPLGNALMAAEIKAAQRSTNNP